MSKRYKYPRTNDQTNFFFLVLMINGITVSLISSHFFISIVTVYLTKLSQPLLGPQSTSSYQ